MFRGQQKISFTTSKSKQSMISELENAFLDLGGTMIEESGKITISPSNEFTSFAHDSIIEGYFRQNDKTVNITINYESKLNIVGWITLGIGFFIYLFGILILILPYNGKKKLEKKIQTILQEVKFDLGEV